ncbi:MAG: PBP1A family penicillin-binding protein [Thermodesulfobacteriota bacterium]
MTTRKRTPKKKAPVKTTRKAPAKTTAKKRPSPKGSPRKRAVRRKPFVEKHVIGFFLLIALLLTGFLGVLLYSLVALKIPDIRSVAHYQPQESTVIYDRHGRVIDQIYLENRMVLEINEIPPLLAKAFVSAEDSRFYDHPGLDFWSVLRAAVINLKRGRRGQGGSTITQQVARSLLLTPEKTYLRKFKEAILAWRIDTLLEKDEILYIYLNQIYLGSGAHGVETAAQTYYGKSARRLSLGEMALLAGLPQAPSRYSPLKNLQKARRRQRYVLNRMAEEGYVTIDQARTAYGEEIRLNKGAAQARERNGYYLQLVRKQAAAILERPLSRAGVRIYTSLDQNIQVKADRAVARGVADSMTRSRSKQPPQAALVAMESCSGRVRALVGGTDFSESPFDRASQASRSAGSLFKPLLYAAAFEHGYSPSTLINDEPLTIRGHDGRPWRPKNFSGRHYGATSLKEALVNSRNVVTVKLLQKMGIAPLHKLAKSFGLRGPFTNDLSLALGATGVSLLEITAAYMPFNCKGKHHDVVVIEKIVDHKGKTLWQADDGMKRVLSADTAGTMKGLLGRVITEGTGRRAQGLTGYSGGKTGTTNDNRDAWFVGITPALTAGVWFGNDHNEPLGNSETGGVAAAPVWLDFMKQLRSKK